MDILQNTNLMVVKICRVCGDKAIGFNFNGLTCESCKSFFRRNALKYEKYKCRKDGTCVIDFVTRKCCTRCRLDKCFANGMRKELIYSKTLNADHSNQTLPSIGLHRTGSVSSSCVSSEDSPQSAHSLHIGDHHNIDTILDRNIRAKMYSLPEDNRWPDQSDADQCPTAQLCSPRPRLHYLIELNQWERSLLHEIEFASDSAEFYQESRFELIGEVTDLVYALNLAELYIRKTIKFCKSFQVFRGLCPADQLVMLKDFFTEMMIIRFGFVYDPEKDAIPVIENEEKKLAVLVKLSLLYEAKKQNMLFYCRQNLFRLNQLMDNDCTISDMIMVIRLFKPREDITCPEFIRYQSCVYERLLHRYLEHKYQDGNTAMRKVAEFNELLTQVNPARAILEGIFVESIESSQLSVVLTEVYGR